MDAGREMYTFLHFLLLVDTPDVLRTHMYHNEYSETRHDD